MIWLLRAALAAAVVCGVVFSPPSLGLDEQLWLGASALAGHTVPTALGPESFSAAGLPSGAFGWLTDVFEALVAQGAGRSGLAFVEGLALAGALALVEARARRRASELVAFGAAVLAAATFFAVLRSGAGAEGWLAAAAFVYVLDGKERRSALFAVVLGLLWCNLSAAGCFAAGLAFLVALGRSSDLKTFRAPAARLAWLTCAGCALALLVTPGGLNFPALAPLALHLDGNPALPVVVAPLAYRTGFTATLLLATYFGLRGAPLEDVLPSLGVLVLVLVDGQMLPLLGIVAAPVLAGSVQRALPDLPLAPARLAGWARVVACALLAAFAAGTWSAVRASASDIVPGDLIARLRADGRAHRVLCARLEWCGSTVAAGDPSLRVFMDQREAAYPKEVRDAQRLVTTAHGAWRQKLRTANVDAIVADRHSIVAGLLEASKDWSRAGEQDGARLYLRQGGPSS